MGQVVTVDTMIYFFFIFFITVRIDKDLSIYTISYTYNTNIIKTV